MRFRLKVNEFSSRILFATSAVELSAKGIALGDHRYSWADSKFTRTRLGVVVAHGATSKRISTGYGTGDDMLYFALCRMAAGASEAEVSEAIDRWRSVNGRGNLAILSAVILLGGLAGMLHQWFVLLPIPIVCLLVRNWGKRFGARLQVPS